MAKKRFQLAALMVLTLMAAHPLNVGAIVTQTFKTQQVLVAGNMVSLTSPDTVVAATPANLSGLYGVVTSVSPGTVEVATSEVVMVLVCTANGDIVPGNPITVSVVEGVGQKAIVSTRIVGYAQAALSAKTKGATLHAVKDASGNSHSYYFGLIPVLMGVGYWLSAAGGNSQANSDLPPVLQNFFDKLAGHHVSPSKALLAIFLTLVAVVVVGMLIGTSVHSTMMSIGRNPLASKKLFRGLAQVIAVGILILGAAMGAVVFIIGH